MPEPDPLDVRVLADDLTGALDSAVAFAGGDGIAVTGRPGTAGAPPPGRRAVDAATREAGTAEAVRRHAALARWLAAGDVSFKKVDSLLRGHVGAEIAACVDGGGYARAVVAPAFPAHGRVTRAGRQWRLDRGEPVGPDLAAALAPRRDADLDRIAAAFVAAPSRTLWVGSGGLAAALARRLGIRPAAPPPLAAPLVGFVGTDSAATVAQVARFAEADPDGPIVVTDIAAARARLAARMAEGRPAVLTVPAAGDRAAAAATIDAAFAAVAEAMPRPGTLFVTGGETLRALCDRLGAAGLTVESEIEPGIPVSRIDGGRFAGVRAVTKSGGFGDADLIARLCRAATARPVR
jgi:uncharacterized protein YgbK (DUF1537 family)